jgi:hypothetical protein
LRRLALVTIPALAGNTFRHQSARRSDDLVASALEMGLLRITYIYRDPRDAMLSAYEFGQRALAKGRPNAFSHLSDFEKTLVFIEGYLRIWAEMAG